MSGASNNITKEYVGDGVVGRKPSCDCGLLRWMGAKPKAEPRWLLCIASIKKITDHPTILQNSTVMSQ